MHVVVFVCCLQWQSVRQASYCVLNLHSWLDVCSGAPAPSGTSLCKRAQQTCVRVQIHATTNLQKPFQTTNAALDLRFDAAIINQTYFALLAAPGSIVILNFQSRV